SGVCGSVRTNDDSQMYSCGASCEMQSLSWPLSSSSSTASGEHAYAAQCRAETPCGSRTGSMSTPRSRKNCTISSAVSCSQRRGFQRTRLKADHPRLFFQCMSAPCADSQVAIALSGAQVVLYPSNVRCRTFSEYSIATSGGLTEYVALRSAPA